MSAGENSIYESEPILKNQAFYSKLKQDPDLQHAQPVAYKPVILQSDKFDQTLKRNGKDTVFVRQEIHGAMLKGVDNTYDWTFFKENLKEGRVPVFKSTVSNELILSAKIAKNLNLKVGEDVKAFFVKNQPIKKVFKLVGIFETGLEEFDQKIAIGDLRLVQQLNDWGIQASIKVEDTLYNGQFIVRGDVIGGNGNYRYNWGKGFENYSGFTICPVKDTVIRLIASDYWSNIDGKNETTSIPDTAYLKITISGTGMSYCDPKTDNQGMITREYLNESGSRFAISSSQKKISFEQIDGPGSSHNYIGGFELSVKDWNTLPEVHQRLKKQLEFIPTIHNESIAVRSIIENESDIFVWLGFLDLNVFIILTLMILIGIINMGSALLVLILVRSNFIGLLKSMGATNWTIRKIFLIQAGYLILRGMIIGNVTGLALCGIQSYFNVLTLNPEVYYLDTVPVDLSIWVWLALNAGTLIVCISALIIPSYAITKISPVKAIRFN